MDKRQKKTRAAIFNAFTALLEEKTYSAISIQNIIDKALIGRSTFYAHFETKEALVEALCGELFDHIITTAMHKQDTNGLYFCSNPSYSVTCHILHHLLENDHNILTLLSCESSDLFLRFFKTRMDDLVCSQFLKSDQTSPVPQNFLISHISGTFVETVQWWLKGDRKQTPEELDAYFHAVIDPIISQ